MSRDFRFGAVVSGYLTLFFGSLLLLSLFAAWVFLFLKPRSREELTAFIESPQFFAALLAIWIVIGGLAGLVTGVKAGGRELTHALALILLLVAWFLLLDWLRESGLRPDVPELDFAKGRSVTSYVLGWASPLVGALVARSVRLRKEADLRDQGFSICDRCRFPMDPGTTVCPLCGAVT